MSIHEVIFDGNGQIAHTILRDQEIRDANHDNPNELPTIRTREALRDGYDYVGGEYIQRSPLRIRELQADKYGHVIFRDFIEGVGEDRETPTRVMVSQKVRSGSEINQLNIVLDRRTFMWTPTDVFVASKTEQPV